MCPVDGSLLPPQRQAVNVSCQFKTNPSDENDFKNMIYVQPTDLDWTLEKRWLAIAKEIKLEKYLYTG